MPVRHQRLAVILLSAASLLAACGGGSGSAGSPATPAPAPGLSATAIVLAAGTNVSLAGGGATTTMLAFPAALSGVGSTLGLTATTVAPAGIAAAQARRSALSGTASILEYLIVQASAAVTFSGTPALTFTLPAADITPGGIYTIELYDSSNANAGFVVLSTGTLSGSTLTFPAGTSAFHLPAAPAFVVFALKLTVPGASPSPSPSGMPTPTPTPGSQSLGSSSTYLTFAGPTAAPQALTITETNGAALTESDTCTSGGASIASVTPSGTTTPAQNALSVTVTPHAVGTCALTYKDPAGNAISVGVTVANPAPIVIQ